MAAKYRHYLLEHPASDANDYLKLLVAEGLGVDDLSDEEIKRLVQNPDLASTIFADIVSRRAQIGWSTHGHSAVDVNIYASNRDAAAPLVGNHENTEIGEFLANYLDVNVDSVTKELNERGTSFGASVYGGEEFSWMGPRPKDEASVNQPSEGHLDNLEHYQGEFKKHKRCEMCGH